jgi:hypothetical protein
VSTTHIIQAFSPLEGLILGIQTLLRDGVKTTTRNGAAWVADGPVITEYIHPHLRVLSSRQRDANPFFHLAESAWMLMGRNDIEFLSYYAKNMANYSVDGKTQHAAYGHRWTSHFNVDQVQAIIDKLKAQPNTRQAVLQLWDARVDLVDSEENSKDRCCNLLAIFTPRTSAEGETSLDMMVSNRSNDIVWGAYGANAVHFSFLHHLIAELSGFQVGVYRQVSDNYHMYDENLYGHKLFNSLVNADRSSVCDSLSFMREADCGWISSQNEYVFNNKGYCPSWFGGVTNLADLRTALESFFEALPRLVESPEADEPHLITLVREIAHTSGHGQGLIQTVLPIMMIAHGVHKGGQTQLAARLLQEASDAFIGNKVFLGVPDETSDPSATNPSPGEFSPCDLDWFHAGHTWLQRRM